MSDIAVNADAVRARGARSRRAGAVFPIRSLVIKRLMSQLPEFPSQRRRRSVLTALDFLIHGFAGEAVAATPVVPCPCRGIAGAEYQQAPILGLGVFITQSQRIQTGAGLHEGIHPTNVIIFQAK